ncbi:hypothetical protein ACFWUQ_21165, partial [Streptomyces sp. NPDC058662]
MSPQHTPEHTPHHTPEHAPGHGSEQASKSAPGPGAKRAARTERRRRLRREVPATVGLLTDPGDFAAMRVYRSFTFGHHDDYADYLRHVDDLLRSLAAQGIHTSVVLFDPEEYADFCTETGLEPDTAETRSRFTAELAGRAAVLPYTGQPVDELVPLLLDAAVRQATWEYATALLAGVGPCADCGEDIGRASLGGAPPRPGSKTGAAGPRPPPHRRQGAPPK